MVDSKSITEQLTKFNNFFYDLVNIEVKVEDGDKALFLLCALPIESSNNTENQGVKKVQGLEV